MLGHARPCSAMLGHARSCSAMLGHARPCSGAYFSPKEDIFTARATWTHHRATLAPLALLLEDAWAEEGAVVSTCMQP
jgi:hypothetical protein